MVALKAWPAPAKINRMLRIVGRRKDGCHNLQTIFQFLNYCDWLWFQPSNNGMITLNYQTSIPIENNLIFRAACLLRDITAISPQNGVSINVLKKLPVGSGLGGGSSNAATTLIALNYYWRLGLTLTELATIGCILGADIPVFIHGKAAWAEGIGEVITPIMLDEPWFLIVIPPCEISTSYIFNKTELTRNSPQITIGEFIQGNYYINDCENVVYNSYPAVAAAAAWLNTYAEARLTGTGSCIFAPFSNRQKATWVLAQIPKGLTGFVTRGLNQSPVHKMLKYNVI